MSKKKEIEFSEKIDELNQETDSLLEEIDKFDFIIIGASIRYGKHRDNLFKLRASSCK